MPIKNDTILRCGYCQSVVLHKHVTETGGCKVCGSRRLTIAFKLTDDEVEQCKAEGYTFDPKNWDTKPSFHDDVP